MTSPERHLDLDQLADMLAGEASLGAEEHVAGCAQCRADLEELVTADAAVAAQLAALPALAVPGDVADRLAAALEAEDGSAQDASEDGPAAGTGATTVTPFPTAADAGPARWLAAAAAVVVLLGGGIYGISRLGHDSGSAVSASRPSKSSRRSPSKSSAGTRVCAQAVTDSSLPLLTVASTWTRISARISWRRR